MDEALSAWRALHFASAMLLAGAGAFRVYAVNGSDAELLEVLDARLRALLLVASIVALLSAVALVPCVASPMAGSAAAALDWNTISAVVFQTSFGRVWRWHLAIAALLVAICAVRRVRPAWRAALAALLLASLGWVGHAAAGRGLRGIGHSLNDAVHLLAGGLWLGGLVPLGGLAIQAWRSQNGAWLAMLVRALPRFSRLAYAAVALVALSGIINAVLLVGSIGALPATPYGRLLMVKVALFLLLLAVAVINRLILVPWIGSGARNSGGATALSWTIAVELLLGLGIIAVVAVLGTLPPAIHAHAQ